jgi:crotonobetainyl-CoA:carnitine CoA-transferase CaiB-like acyl-CoA transferase
MAGPLAGIRVIDLTSVGMGPYATQILGDMGADVIKVEAPEGDVFRHAAPYRHPGMGAAYLNLNRNKRSIVLDLKECDQLKILLRLVAAADVFIYSIRPQAVRKLGLGYEALSETNPRLIYCGVYGFSEAGPYAGRPAFDDIIQAMSGLASLQGNNNPDGPRYVNTIVADKTAGLNAAWAIAMALFERERSGKGQAIEVPMFETLVSFNLVEHLAGETFRPAEGGMGYDRVLSPHRRPYRTKDGYIGLMPYTNAHWRRFFTLAGRPELTADERFSDPSSRSRNIEELYGVLAEMVAGKSTAEWTELLAEADIPMTTVKSPEDLLADRHLAKTGFFRDEVHPTEGPIRSIGIPVGFSRTPGSFQRPAPGLDEHRAEILAELEKQT